MSSAPVGSPAELYAEKINILSPIIGTWTHGVLFAVTALCIHTLLVTKNSPLPHKWFHVGYVCLLFILGTCGGVVNIALVMTGFIYNREYPGGPLAYFATHYNSRVSITGFSAFVVATWLQDGYLVYRFMTIYQFRVYVYAIPTLMFLGSIACSCMLLNALSEPGANIWKKASIDLATPYWTLSISLNVLLTTLIVSRILWAKRQSKKIPGEWNDKIYTTIATLMIESAALYSIVGLIYLILYVKGNTMQEILLAILGEVQCIAPMLIIYRLAKGTEWSPQKAKLDTTGPYDLSTLRTTHLEALRNGNTLTEATSNGVIELVGKKIEFSCPDVHNIV